MHTYLDFRKKIDYIELKKVAEIIKNGEVVVFPTETVYGIGANGLNPNSIKKLYEAKKRPLNKPINLLVNSISMVDNIAKDITDIEYKLMKKFFPGPLTIILNKKDIVPDLLTANGSTVGVRMPENDIALKLIEYSGVPLATSSCNISGMPSRTTVDNIIDDFDGKVSCFISGGRSKIGLASTIVQVIEGIPHILREGSITKRQIEKTILE